MSKSPRCLYESTIADFIHETDMHIFGSLNNITTVICAPLREKPGMMKSES